MVVGDFEAVKGMGMVEEVIKPEKLISGDRGIGHVRYMLKRRKPFPPSTWVMECSYS